MSSLNENTVLLNLPKDLGDCLIAQSAVASVARHCKKNGLDLVTTGKALQHSWVSEFTGLSLAFAKPQDLQGTPQMLVDLNFYDRSVSEQFAHVPTYAPERLKVIEADGKDFGTGAVVGKKHVLELLRDCLRDAGIIRKSQWLSIPLLPEDFTSRENVATVKEKFGIAQKYALIIPVCAADRPFKMWQKEKFADVAQGLLNKGVVPVFLGGPSEAEKNLCAELNATIGGQGVDVAGKTSLKDIAGLAKGAAFILGNDTGPSHIAAATGTPTFVFFGYYNDPKTWKPEGAHVIKGKTIQDIGVKTVLGKITPHTGARHILGFGMASKRP